MPQAASSPGGPARVTLGCTQTPNPSHWAWSVPAAMLAIEFDPAALARLCPPASFAPAAAPTALVWRYDPDNLYHTLEGVVGALQTARIAALDPRRARLAFLDGHPPCPADALYRYAFDAAPPPGPAPPGNATLCLRDAVLMGNSATGSVLPTAFLPPRRICRDGGGSDMLRHFSDYLLQRMGLQHLQPPGRSGFKVWACGGAGATFFTLRRGFCTGQCQSSMCRHNAQKGAV